MPFFQCNNLYTHVGGPFSFQIEKGECMTISGKSGTGKTLLLRALADLDEHRGDITLAGITQSQIPAPEWRKKVMYLPANSSWWFETVGEHFFSDTGIMWEKLDLDSSLKESSPDKISSGQKQRLALIRGLQYKPQCLLLDEPSSHLDEENSLAVESLISEYLSLKESCVVWVTHQSKQLDRFSGPHLDL